eukprot:279564-Prorocentrum_minimum.AAC.2
MTVWAPGVLHAPSLSSDGFVGFDRMALCRAAGSGMNLKMFVGDLNDAVESTFHQWAAAGKRQALVLGRPFPQLRASADVLMMPKACLTDPAVREEVGPVVIVTCKAWVAMFNVAHSIHG